MKKMKNTLIKRLIWGYIFCASYGFMERAAWGWSGELEGEIRIFEHTVWTSGAGQYKPAGEISTLGSFYLPNGGRGVLLLQRASLISGESIELEDDRDTLVYQEHLATGESAFISDSVSGRLLIEKLNDDLIKISFDLRFLSAHDYRDIASTSLILTSLDRHENELTSGTGEVGVDVLYYPEDDALDSESCDGDSSSDWESDYDSDYDDTGCEDTTTEDDSSSNDTSCEDDDWAAEASTHHSRVKSPKKWRTLQRLSPLILSWLFVSWVRRRWHRRGGVSD